MFVEVEPHKEKYYHTDRHRLVGRFSANLKGLMWTYGDKHQQEEFKAHFAYKIIVLDSTEFSLWKTVREALEFNKNVMSQEENYEECIYSTIGNMSDIAIASFK